MEITEYTIELHDIHLFAHHGVMPQEREIGAWFTINIDAGIKEHSCMTSDCIDGTVSYADIYDIICNEMKKPSNLLENVCHRISKAIYMQFTTVSWISITLCKDTPPMGGDRMKASVTLKSKR
jgi:dihydroneopterin aldolase